MKAMFWQVGTQLIEFIVPIVALIIIFKLFYAGLYGDKRT